MTRAIWNDRPPVGLPSGRVYGSRTTRHAEPDETETARVQVGVDLYCGECGERLLGTRPPTWSSPAEMVAVVGHPPHLRRTLLTTAIVGTVLFCINQLDVVLAGDASTTVWFKSALTYLVPFAVSNIGILIATHRRR